MHKDTKTVDTVHGTVDYETVKCSSCDNEVHTDMAADYLVGKLEGQRSGWGGQQYEFDQATLQRGYLCPHCVDAGPINTPGAPTIHSKLIEKLQESDLFMICMSAGILLCFLALAITIVISTLGM